MIRGWWPVLHRQKTQTEENTHRRKHTQETHTGHTDRKHRQKTHRENTDKKHRQKTQTENTERKDREKTQTENTDRKHRQKTQRENTDRKHTDRKNTQRKNTQRKHTERTHREKTRRENTQRKHREKTQKEVLHNTTKYYTILFHTTKHHMLRLCTTKYYTALRVGAGNRAQGSRESSPGPPASKANALSARQIFWDDHIQKIVIANTMRGAIVQIQNTNVHTPRPMRGAIPIAQNLRFANQFRGVDPPNPTRGFIRQNQNVRFATAACHPKCQNVRFATAACAKMYEMSAWRRQSPAAYKNHRFTTVSDVRPARSDERVARRAQKFAFHHSFGHPTSTK